jgi:hypothetical protein
MHGLAGRRLNFDTAGVVLGHGFHRWKPGEFQSISTCNLSAVWGALHLIQRWIGQFAVPAKRIAICAVAPACQGLSHPHPPFEF